MIPSHAEYKKDISYYNIFHEIMRKTMKNEKTSNLRDMILDETFDIEPDEIRKIGYHTTDLIVDYFKNIHTRPILPEKTLEQMRELLNEPLPQIEQTPRVVLDECKKKIIENAVLVGHPRFLGWILASGTAIGAFADGIASALNQNVAISGVGMATATEMLVIDWIKEILGYDSKAGGILVSGGSIANLISLTIARNVKAQYDIATHGIKQDNNMVIYASEEVHMCIPKAVNILGIGTNNIRWIKVNDNYRLDILDLEFKIAEDKKKGKHPFAVVATAGTVNTGAIDPLESIADVCQKHNLWFHVDAAYGGFAALSPKLKPLLNGISRADSIALDPHKWLFIPFEAGCVLVKNPFFMTQTFTTKTDYIHADSTKIPLSDDVDYSEYGIQLSRGFRALKIWMSLKQYGVEKYGRIIEQNTNLARYMAELIEESPDFNIMFPVNLSIVCFRYVPKDINKKYKSRQKKKIEEYLNHLNKAIVQALRADRRAYVSSTILEDKFVLRACIVNHRTTKKDIVDIIGIIRELAITEDDAIRNKFL